MLLLVALISAALASSGAAASIKDHMWDHDPVDFPGDIVSPDCG